ncbi:MAG: 30S ribosomal protein S5 [Candidatus Tectomicrobia bacterium]|uniref:Small ribosomal subunit protein uS5 n=1 Tax=Tectimicrobiota bacterium TaxID=2528274 RepID=A0A933LQL0_UNCTE|nr:30S ribosomal protein S5 [Candidatus Tectomicrobia bacterium]
MQKPQIESEERELKEKLVFINRVSKVVKGGKRLNFSALVVVGDENGRVSFGLGKAREVPEAIRKAGAFARKRMASVTLKGNTIPHEIREKFGASIVLLKPAAPGTGIIAGGATRAILEVAGVRDVIAKILGSSNPINVVKATIMALSRLQEPEIIVGVRKGVKEKENA